MSKGKRVSGIISMTKKTKRTPIITERIPFRLEGNKGGDYIELIEQPNDCVHVEVGSCCVRTMNATVPVEFLTALISYGTTFGNDGIKDAIDTFDWSEAFKADLKSKVKLGDIYE